MRIIPTCFILCLFLTCEVCGFKTHRKRGVFSRRPQHAVRLVNYPDIKDDIELAAVVYVQADPSRNIIGKMTLYGKETHVREYYDVLKNKENVGVGFKILIEPNWKHVTVVDMKPEIRNMIFYRISELNITYSGYIIRAEEEPSIQKEQSNPAPDNSVSVSSSSSSSSGSNKLQEESNESADLTTVVLPTEKNAQKLTQIVKNALYFPANIGSGQMEPALDPAKFNYTAQVDGVSFPVETTLDSLRIFLWTINLSDAQKRTLADVLFVDIVTDSNLHQAKDHQYKTIVTLTPRDISTSERPKLVYGITLHQSGYSVGGNERCWEFIFLEIRDFEELNLHVIEIAEDAKEGEKANVMSLLVILDGSSIEVREFYSNGECNKNIYLGYIRKQLKQHKKDNKKIKLILRGSQSLVDGINYSGVHPNASDNSTTSEKSVENENRDGNTDETPNVKFISVVKAPAVQIDVKAKTHYLRFQFA